MPAFPGFFRLNRPDIPCFIDFVARVAVLPVVMARLVPVEHKVLA
jgi:hypothetical protein